MTRTRSLWAAALAALLLAPLGAGTVRAADSGIRPPVKPVITQVFPRDGAVAVDYVLGAGGGTATLRAVPVGDGDGLDLVLGADAGSGRARVDGLDNGTAYVFTLVQDIEIPTAGLPVHKTAVSEPSEEVTPVPASVPGAPVVTDVFPRDGALRVRWSSADDGGEDLTGTWSPRTPAVAAPGWGRTCARRC
ncbi:hypothetical protein [Kitasatospora phosalacinea]|uniref:Uncharacterized protein n=1 Tax=Kitasatospora phosalacinea TaxID=2065 RepID=A0ABW6GJL7_9ACTN